MWVTRYTTSLLTILAISATPSWTFVQSQEAVDCPIVRVSCPDTDIVPLLKFSAVISGTAPSTQPTFSWKVSAGRIVGGQGTPSITVDTESPEYGGTFEASVEVGGLPGSCAKIFSCTTYVIRDPPAKRVDEYAGLGFKDEKARLDRFIAELRKDPTAQGYVLSYAGRRARPGEARWRGERARRYLLRAGGFATGQIVAIDGGYKEIPTIELYIVPSGVTPPPASPTVDPDEVNIIGRRRKRPR